MFNGFNIKTELSETKTITTSKVIASYSINMITIILHTSANISVILLDKNNNLISNLSLTMKDSDYEQWNSDDTYVNKWIENEIQKMETI
jgi:hypothetical protein